ncbi:MAG TPA: bifunctional glutamate N-acetyltransferase/amino-acid acetyltransferase ArgJ [Chthoniobacterales bacterium]|nr:bifunctional glutamate N-acetyltransferase/amino-acid acetyltransferase ArgJ [Chthoniobacterales bacterium]
MSDENNFKTISGSICAPRGFKAAAVFCDIKKLGTGKGSEKGQKRDLALIVSDVPAAVAGMFTTNQVCAAPVKISAPRAAKDFARVIVVNSGNANACTGRQGLRDAEMTARKTAEAVAALYEGRKSSNRATVIERPYRRITADDVLVCSTGRIGVPMPMKNVERGIRECAPLLARSTTNAREVAEAIMTTDTRRKEIAVEFKIDNRAVRIGGICKGAGMIEPGMTRSGARHATMLAFITSDAAIESNALKRALEAAVGQSFNRISVDGDMSTNDSVIMLANGLAGNSRIKNRNSRLEIFRRALAFVTLELAKMIVRDAEGATRFISLHVHGARSAREAEAAARAIANSTLVKTSWCGGDPNWGRILCALGYSTAKVGESIVDVGYSRAGERKISFAFRRGRPTNVALNTLAKITSAPQFDLHVDLHAGAHDFAMYASDLTEDYVELNKGDLSDPSTLGG